MIKYLIKLFMYSIFSLIINFPLFFFWNGFPFSFFKQFDYIPTCIGCFSSKPRDPEFLLWAFIFDIIFWIIVCFVIDGFKKILLKNNRKVISQTKITKNNKGKPSKITINPMLIAILIVFIFSIFLMFVYNKNVTQEQNKGECGNRGLTEVCRNPK